MSTAFSYEVAERSDTVQEAWAHVEKSGARGLVGKILFRDQNPYGFSKLGMDECLTDECLSR
jgi:hypothetical protein